MFGRGGVIRGSGNPNYSDGCYHDGLGGRDDLLMPTTITLENTNTLIFVIHMSQNKTLCEGTLKSNRIYSGILLTVLCNKRYLRRMN